MILLQAGTSVELIANASSKTVFEADSPSGYKPPPKQPLELVHESSDSQFVLTNTNSSLVVVFHDFSVATDLRGRLKEVTSVEFRESNKDGVLYSYSSGKVNQITTSEGQEYSIDFLYSGDLLSSITVKEGTNEISKVEYTYFQDVTNASSDIGSMSDLVQVKRSRKDSSDQWIDRYTQYRYDSDSRIKGVFSHSVINRINDAGDNAVDTPSEIMTKGDSYAVASGTTIENHVQRWFEYYSSDEDTTDIVTPWASTGEDLEDVYTSGGSNRDETGFVRSERVGLGDCSSCGSGRITRHYSYLTLSQGDPDDNEVVYLVVEDIKDQTGSAILRTVFGLNDAGAMLRRLVTPDPSDKTMNWCRSWVLSSESEWTASPKKRARITSYRPPSAHKVEAQADIQKFLDPFDDGSSSGTGEGTGWANDNATLRSVSDSDPGPIYLFEYNSEGYKTTKRVKRGHDAMAEYCLLAWDYGDGTNVPVSYMTARYSYPEPTVTRSSGVSTTASYDFWDDDKLQLKSKTLTYPSVPMLENGSGSSSTYKEYFDRAGRLRWTQDGEGYITYYSYEQSSDLLAYEAVDVNPSSMPASASDASLVAPTDDGDGDSTYDSTAIPSRDAGLPDPIEAVTFTEFNATGSPIVVTRPDGSRHFRMTEKTTTGTRLLRFPHLDANGDPQLPVSVTVRDALGLTTEEFSVRADYPNVSTQDGLPTGFSVEPSQADYTSWTRYFYNADDGKLVKTLRYHKIPDSGDGQHIDNYYVTAILNDSLGRGSTRIQTVTTSSHQVSRRSYDVLGRGIKEEQGTGDTLLDTGPNSDTGMVSIPTMSVTREWLYDGGTMAAPLQVGDGRRTGEVIHHTATHYTLVTHHYTYRGHSRGREMHKNGSTWVGPCSVRDIDWRGRTLATSYYTAAVNWSGVLAGDGYTDYVYDFTTDEPDASGHNELSVAYYNQASRVYKKRSYPGTEDDRHFQWNYFYDRNSRLVAVDEPYGISTEYAYNGIGQRYQVRQVLALESPAYSSGSYSYCDPQPKPGFASDNATAMTGGDGNVIELSHLVIDPAGLVLEKHDFETTHADTDGLDLSSNDDYVRRSTYRWYDDLSRTSTVAFYGSGGAATGSGSWAYHAPPTRPSSAPTSSSDSAIVLRYEYDSRTGRARGGVSPAADGYGSATVTSRMFWDDLGRVVFRVDNYDDFSAATLSGIGDATDDTKDRVTSWEYTGLGEVSKLTAYNGSSTAKQETRYFFEDGVDAALVTHAVYPDSSDTPSSGTDLVELAYNRDGSVKQMTDQRGVVHDYKYDDRRRLELDAASTVPAGVYGGSSESDAVKSIGYQYDDMGRLEYVTSYAGTTAASTVLNEVRFQTNAYGLPFTDWQAHDGAVARGTLFVRYQYDETYDSTADNAFSNGLRLQLERHPSDSLVTRYQYDGLIHDRRHTPSGIADATNESVPPVDRVAYQVTGSGRAARTYYPGPQIESLVYDPSSPADYSKLDRFGRVLTKQWRSTAVGNALKDQVDYTYDYASNRLTRSIPSSLYSSADRDQGYEYDGLNRLTLAESGTSSVAKLREEWELDHLGNWETSRRDGTLDYTTAADNDFSDSTDAARNYTHNNVNEITDIEGLYGNSVIDPVYDDAGNKTTMPQPSSPGAGYTAVYDSWNRMIQVKDGATVLLAMEYDGLARRIVKTDRPATTNTRYDYYYNNKWQVLQVRKGSSGNPWKQYVYHPGYIDGVALRVYDENTDGDTLDPDEGSLYYLHDARYDVTAVTDDGGAVQERYWYTPYGEVLYLNDGFSALSPQESVVDNEYLYTGRRRDPETGLQLNRTRSYESAFGLWGARDPIGYHSGSTNLYEYVGGDPIRWLDALGLRRVAIFPPNDDPRYEERTLLKNAYEAAGFQIIECSSIEECNHRIRCDTQGDGSCIDTLVTAGHGNASHVAFGGTRRKYHAGDKSGHIQSTDDIKRAFSGVDLCGGAETRIILHSCRSGSPRPNVNPRAPDMISLAQAIANELLTYVVAPTGLCASNGYPLQPFWADDDSAIKLFYPKPIGGNSPLQ